MKVTMIPIVNWMLGTLIKSLVQELEDLEITGDHLNNSIIKVGQNNEKSLRDLRRLAVTLTPGACGVMVIVVGNGHGDTSSNPGRDWLHFT